MDRVKTTTRSYLIAAATVLALALSGCLTPSVPIPPPEPEKMSFEVDLDIGAASFAYDPDPSYAFAVVYVFNRDQGIGVIDTARADGSVGPTESFAAVEDDQIVVTFEGSEGTIGSTCVLLSDGQSSSARECGL
jgi:hypothetical protein